MFSSVEQFLPVDYITFTISSLEEGTDIKRFMKLIKQKKRDENCWGPHAREGKGGRVFILD